MPTAWQNGEQLAKPLACVKPLYRRTLETSGLRLFATRQGPTRLSCYACSQTAQLTADKAAAHRRNGDWAVLLFNRLNTTIDITLDFVDVGNTSQLCWHVRDIWNRTDLGRFSGSFFAPAVPPRQPILAAQWRRGVPC